MVPGGRAPPNNETPLQYTLEEAEAFLSKNLEDSKAALRLATEDFQHVEDQRVRKVAWELFCFVNLSFCRTLWR